MYVCDEHHILPPQLQAYTHIFTHASYMCYVYIIYIYLDSGSHQGLHGPRTILIGTLGGVDGAKTSNTVLHLDNTRGDGQHLHQGKKNDIANV